MRKQALTLALAVALVLTTGACGGGGGGSSADDGGPHAAPSSGGSGSASGGSSQGAADQSGQSDTQAENPPAPSSGSGSQPPLTQGTDQQYLIPALLSGEGDAASRVEQAKVLRARLVTALSAAGILTEPAVQDGLNNLDRFMNEYLAGVRTTIPPVLMTPEALKGMSLLDQLVITPFLLGPAQSGDPEAAALVRALYQVYALMLTNSPQVGAGWASTLATIMAALNSLSTDPLPPPSDPSEDTSPLEIVEKDRGADQEGRPFVMLGLAGVDEPQSADWHAEAEGVTAESTPQGLLLMLVGEGDGRLTHVSASLGARQGDEYVWVGQEDLPPPAPGNDKTVVQGLVVDENDAPVADASVSIREESPAGRPIGQDRMTGGDGRFATEIPVEHAALVVIIAANGYEPRLVELGPQDPRLQAPEFLVELGEIKLIPAKQ